jgi:tetratricopeptide (TPR) repeat protein
MSFIRYFFIFLLCTSWAVSQSDEPNDLFARANEAYVAEEYEKAISLYQTILGQGIHSVELYLNLGNAYFKSDKTAASILYYERGLLLDPTDERILNNLTFAENQRLDKIDPLPLPFGQRVVKSFFSALPIQIWALISIVFGVSGLVLFIYYRKARKRLWMTASILFYVLAFGVFGLTLKAKNIVEKDQSAIVYATRVLVLSEPKEEAPVVFELHEGTKVQLLERFQEYTQIRIANGQSGWMKDSELRRIRLSN